MKVFLTGCAGFIGMHVTKILLARGDTVIGLDNLNDYYDPKLKFKRLQEINSNVNFKFIKGDISDRKLVDDVFLLEKPDCVVNLAAQAGVRYSLENPYVYIQTNLVGFSNLIEASRLNSIKHFVYASSSSVYGANTKIPFSTHDNTDHPISLYAATKKANELIAHTYSHLYALPTTGLRFFTVYGPWGRPDMAPWLFTSAILENRPINVYNNGEMKRDFTYIDDVAEGTVRVLDCIPKGDPDYSTNLPNAASSYAPYKVYNIGNNHPVELMFFIKMIERTVGKKVEKNLMPMQPGDVVSTYADIDDLHRDINFVPKTSLEDGIDKWISWYKKYSTHN